MQLPANRLYLLTYSLGVIVLVFQAFTTVFQLGTTISDNQKISQLQYQRERITLAQAAAEQEAISLVAITNIESQLATDFVPVQKPLVIRTSDSVALR
jgi:hypothetical protein